jgi:hypothetical protein
MAWSFICISTNLIQISDQPAGFQFYITWKQKLKPIEMNIKTPALMCPFFQANHITYVRD